MKKHLFSIILTILLISGVSFAADFSQGTLATVGLSVDFSSQGTASFSAKLLKIADKTTTTDIEWNKRISFHQSSDQWKWSRTYAVLSATVTAANFRVYIYTDNKKNPSSEYYAETPRVEANDQKKYNGLVRKGSKGGQENYRVLSYTISDKELSQSDLNTISYIPDGTTTEPAYLGMRSARYLTDKSDDGFNTVDEGFNGEYSAYSLIAWDYSSTGNIGGFVFYPYGASGFAPFRSDNIVNNTVYMYFGCNFTKITQGDVFGTDLITIEQVTE